MLKRNRRAITKAWSIATIACIIVASLAVGIYCIQTLNTVPSTSAKIGVLEPLTGAQAMGGEYARNAMELAVKTINEAGGIKSLGGMRLEIVAADTQGKPETSRTEAERLILETKVTAILGGYTSSSAMTITEATERYQVPFICAEPTSPRLTDHTNNFTYYFRPGPHDGMFAQAQFDFLREQENKTGQKIGNLCLIYENSLYGTSCGELWRQLANQYGYRVTADVTYTMNTPDLSTEVTKLKQGNPEIIFAVGAAADAITIHRELIRQRVTYKALIAMGAGFTHQDYVNALGTQAEFTMSRMAWCQDLQKENSRTADAKFWSLYKSHFDDVSSRAYAAVWVLYYALEKAASTEPKRVADVLRTLELSENQWIMPFPLKFDQTGQNIYASGVIAQIQNGSYHTVWPGKFATQEAIFRAGPQE